jgi:hypothetical protein
MKPAAMPSALRAAAGGVLLAAAAAAAAQPAPPAAPACAIVFGQGRNASADDDAANTLWDNVNLTFNTQVSTRLIGGRWPVIPLVLRVTATDLQGNVEKLLARAAAEDCDRIVETTIFADYEAKTLVVRLRLHPIERSGPDRAVLRIGAPAFVSERLFPLTRTTLDRVRPAHLADEMAAELLDQKR